LTGPARALVDLASRIPGGRLVAPRTPVILLYHGVPASADDDMCGAVFDEHLAFLKQHCEFVPPTHVEERRRPSDRLRVVLTFDDGFRNNAEVAAPILRRHGVPALFFVTSRHTTPGKYLWFSYLRALERWFPGDGLTFRDTWFDMLPAARGRSIERLQGTLLELTPHPAAMYEAIESELPRLEEFVNPQSLADSYAGMTADQVAELAADPLFSFGIHTADHPFLTKCDRVEALQQVQRNRRWLEDVCGRPCDAIAYPSGDYNDEILEICRQARVKRGYAVIPRSSSCSDMEIPRFGIYAASTAALRFKAHWGAMLRRAGMQLG
jgi:peptidoglycan/xylan/chitin deacetylase (PgdA/CDA1 family)